MNWSEVVQKTLARGASAEGMLAEVQGLGLTIVPFQIEDAELAASLWLQARNLSLGDRACLAVAHRLGATALTADRAWRDLQLGIAVRLIR